MCLIFVANRCVPGYRLVVVANRDEFHARPSTAIHRWHDASHVLAGRDLEAGGTWLGVTARGRFAALTNYADSGAASANRPSRGALVSGFLRDEVSATDYLDGLHERRAHYSGFNLLVDDGGGLGYVSNRGDALHPLTAGIYGLSNHLLDTPWPKVKAGKAKLAALLQDGELPDTEALFEMMGTASNLGADAEHNAAARAHSQAFILGEHYGTRATTVVAVAEQSDECAANGWLLERRFDEHGHSLATEQLNF
jgi:uncharacterized protein with NRDE domain